MLWLNQSAILQAVSMREVIDAVDSAYAMYEAHDFNMPTRMQVVQGDNTLLLMPCVTQEALVTKLVTLFPENIEQPTLHGLMIVNSSETGELKAIMDGTFITGFRTGAIGGSAVRHLARPDARKLAIIGTGTQGLYQAVAACAERPITDIYLYNRSPERLPAFQEDLRKWIGPHINVHPTNTSAEAIADAEIVMTATTSSEPVLPDDATLLQDKLVIGIGSFQPSMREFPEQLYGLCDRMLIDSEDASEESGDIKDPLTKGWIQDDQVQTMASYLASQHGEAPIDHHKGTLFKSTGMALFDAAAAGLIYQKAIEKGVGDQLL